MKNTKGKGEIFIGSPTGGKISEAISQELWYDAGFRDEAKEASKLISKAPEMYEALKAFTNGLDIKNCSPSLMKIVELLKEIES